MANPTSPRLADEAAPVEDERTPLINGRPNGTADDGTVEQTIIPKEQSKSRLVITLASCYVGVFLGALDSTIVATLAAPISTSFNSLSLLSWFASAYLISNAACQPLAGRLTDIFSRRTGLVFSNVMFAVGNLICGLATNEQMIITGRVIAGVGGGGLMAISTFVASDLVPLRKRGVVQGIGNICYGTGAGLGGLFGGWINDTWGWRWAFLVQVPFIVISGLLVFFLINVPAKKSSKSKLKRVDFLGAVTIVVTLVLLLLGLNSGGNIVPWDHPLVLVSLPLSGVMLVAFIYIEAFVAFEPVIPVRLLLDQTVLASCLVNWLTTMVTYMVLFYTPLFFQAKGLSTTSAGLRLIPQSIGSSVGSIGSGLLMNKTGKYQKLGLALMVVFTLGSGLLNTLTFSTQEGPAFIYLFCIGFGYGGMLTVTLLAVISAVSHDHQAVITSATYAFRSTGSTIGITIASTVYQNILKSELWEKFGDRPGAADEIKRIRDSFSELKHLPEGWKTGVMEAYSDALRGVFLTSLVVSVLACVAALFIKQHVLHSSLDRRGSHSNGST